MTFLTPLGALAALGGLPVAAAALLGRARVAAVRGRLGLAPPRGRGLARLAAIGGAFVLVGVAAAQPVLVHRARSERRAGVEALFVLDTSRSMAASASPTSPTRLARAITAAVRLRAAIPRVAAGVATLTDRVLPQLLPVPDVGGFDRTVNRAVAIESPPPRDTSVRATTFAALADIRAGNYFRRSSSRRIVVLLTDGESRPVNPAAIARALPSRAGYRFVAVRVWRSGEAVWAAGGKPEPGYHPDPSGAALLREAAAAAGGRSFEEGNVAAAASYLRSVVGRGPTVSGRGFERRRSPLAPYVAALAAAVLLAALLPSFANRAEVRLLQR